MRTTKRVAMMGAATAAALLLGGIGAGIATAASGGSSQEFGSYVADGRAKPAAVIPALGGVSTTVTLDPSTAQVLQQNGVAVAPVAPATASSSGGQTSVSFPVTGGEAFVFPKNDLPFIRGDVMHSGGLTFSAGGKSLTATNFIVDPGTSILTAQVGDAEVPLFELDGHQVKVGKDDQGHVTLDGTVVRLSPEAAAALNQTFGVTLFKEGIPVGTAHLVLAPANAG